MNARTIARIVLLTAVAAAAALPSFGRAGAPVGGSDLDAVPPGLTPDEEAAWVFEHAPAIRVLRAPPAR